MDNEKKERERKIVQRQGKKRKSVHEPKNESHNFRQKIIKYVTDVDDLVNDEEIKREEKKALEFFNKNRIQMQVQKTNFNQKTKAARKYLKRKLKLKYDKKLKQKTKQARLYLKRKLKINSTVNYDKIDRIQYDNQQSLPNDTDELVNDKDIKKAQKEAFKF